MDSSMLNAERIRVRQEILSLEPYVLGKPPELLAKELGISIRATFALNQNPIGPSPKALAEIESALKQGRVHRYPDTHAYLLKQAVAKHLNEVLKTNAICEENIIVGSGSGELIRGVAETFVNPGDEVIVGTPEYPPFSNAIKFVGGTPVQFFLDSSYRTDLQAVEKLISPKTRMIMLTNPRSVTGTIFTKREFDAFIRRLPSGIHILLDECYSDFVERDQDYPDGVNYVAKGYPIIVLRTLSKAHGLAGVRVGYGVASKDRIDYLHRSRPLFSVSSLAQVAGIAAISDKLHLRRTKNLVWKEKKFFYKELDRRGVTYVPTQTNFICINVGDDKRVFSSMLKLGITTSPGFWYGMPGWMPVTINMRDKNALFISCLLKALSQ